MDNFEHHGSSGDLHELVTTFDDTDGNGPPSTTAWNFSNIEVSSEQFDWSLDSAHASSPRPGNDRPRQQISSTVLPVAEKRVGNPTSPVDGRRPFARGISSSTPTTLTRLFAFHSSNSASSSRTQSYNQTSPKSSAKTAPGVVSTLPIHLYTRGLLGGRHSDITVHAFGNAYALHRLILDRAPYFASAFSEPWLESTAKDVNLHPEETDPNITSLSFELALKRLYGCRDRKEEEQEAIGLFATGCWLEMEDLVDDSVACLLQKLSPENLSSILKLVENSYYGKQGERILSSAKAMLYRVGWEMPIKYWDGVSGDMAREIIGGDGFYVSTEWDRWYLAKRLLDRRLQAAAIDADLLDTLGRPQPILSNATKVLAARRDSMERKIVHGTESPTIDRLWLSLYAHPDIEPILNLLEDGIHYMHLDFEHLQVIKSTKDILGIPILSEKIIADALWMSIELRQKILNSAEKQMELNLSTVSFENSQTGASYDGLEDQHKAAKGKGMGSELHEQGTPSSSAREAVYKRFWIPRADRNVVMGGGAEPVITSCDSTPRLHSPNRPFEDTIAVAPTDTRPRAPSFTSFPPFRFAVEFPNPLYLRNPGRMYSRTVFYAGSLWNLYVQKTQAPSKEVQVEVYLNRTTEQQSDEIAAAASGLSQRSVDERIGQLEREMLLRSERRAFRHRSRPEFAIHDESNVGDVDTTLLSMGQSEPFSPPRISGLASTLSTQSSTARSFYDVDDTHNDLDSDDVHLEEGRAIAPQIAKAPAMPRYKDPRTAVKTYFKIYIPSNGGRLLVAYESIPVPFSFQQSWGWTSTKLMMEDDALTEDNGGIETGGYYEDEEGDRAGKLGESPEERSVGLEKEPTVAGDFGRRKAREQKLRLVVVLGHT